MAVDQITDFIEKADAVAQAPQAPDAPAAASAPDPNDPKVPFQSALVLTAEQEKAMLDHAFKRLTELGRDNGRDQTINPTWWQNLAPAANMFLAAQGLHPADTWMGKRARYDAIFHNDVSWRPWTMGPDNIFMASNFAVPVLRRITRQMIAKAINGFFATDPWVSIDPAPVPDADQDMDEEVIDRIERFCQFKLAECHSKEDKKRAIKRALVLGECAVKTSYVVRDQIFNTEAEVLTDVTGQAVRDAQGNHITKDDQPETDGTGNQVLAKDHVTPYPDAPIWTKQPITRRQVLFEGVKSEPIYYKDFLCPMMAADVQTADCIAHLYDKPVMEFVDLVVKRGMIDGSTGERMKAAGKIVTLVKALSENTATPKAAVSQEFRPNENFMPIPGGDEGQPVAEFVEFYMWFDVNGDGIAENVMLIADRKTQLPIFYDYVANVTTDGLRPIEIIRVNPVEGRWYGLGVIELFESYQTVIDLMVNRWNFSQSRSGRVDLWNPTNTQEGDRDPNLKMNWGGSYTKKPGMKKEDILEVVYLTDIKFEQIKLMIEFFLQLAMNESGIASANDAQMAGMQSGALATGILQVQQSGDELLKPIIDDLTDPLTRLLNREIDVLLSNMNPEEVFTYLEGETLGVDKLTPEDVRGLKFKCKIEMTTHKNQQQMQVSGQAAALVEKFYTLPPEVQEKVASFYRDQLRALCPTCQVNIVISPMPPLPPPMPGMEAMPNGGNGAAKKPPNGRPTGATAASSTQLIQRSAQPTGVTAPGGTPAG